MSKFKRVKITKQNQANVLNQAVKALQDGGLVVFPTETCYGIGVDATNQDAVDKVLKYKARREGKPISIAVTDEEMANKYVEINDIAHNIYENYLPGPITVVSKSLDKVAKGLSSEFGTLGIRIPDYPDTLALVKELKKPITSTSANVSYKPSPYSIDQLLDQLPNKQKEMISFIIDAGTLPKNPTSTVVDTTLNNLNVMRQGTIQFNKEIEGVTPSLEADTKTAEQTWDFGSLTMLKYTESLNTGAVVFALKGELGAGKTQFVKGLARSLKVNETISSPTFTIVDEYPYEVDEQNGIKGTLYHMDTWRVDGKEEFDRTGIVSYFKKGNILAIEWADKFFVELQNWIDTVDIPVKLINVNFEYTSETSRNIKIYE